MNKEQRQRCFGVFLVSMMGAHATYAANDWAATSAGEALSTHWQLPFLWLNETRMGLGATESGASRTDVHPRMAYDITLEEGARLEGDSEAVDNEILDLLPSDSRYLHVDYVEQKADALLADKTDQRLMYGGYLGGFKDWATMDDPTTRFSLEVLAPASSNSIRLFGFVGGSVTEVLHVLPAWNTSELMLNSGIGARWQTTEDFNLSLHSGYELRDAKVNGGDGAALHFNLSYQF